VGRLPCCGSPQAAFAQIVNLRYSWSHHDKALRLLLRAGFLARPDPADDLIDRLKEIEDARTDLLTEEEYSAWRSTVLKQLVARTRVPLELQLMLAVTCLGSIAFIFIGLRSHSGGDVFGGSVCLCIGAYLWYCLEGNYLSKRKLDRSARLNILERLAEMHLINDNEVENLRSRILVEFPPK
jgi:hypothetical protein